MAADSERISIPISDEYEPLDVSESALTEATSIIRLSGGDCALDELKSALSIVFRSMIADGYDIRPFEYPDPEK